FQADTDGRCFLQFLGYVEGFIDISIAVGGELTDLEEGSSVVFAYAHVEGVLLLEVFAGDAHFFTGESGRPAVFRAGLRQLGDAQLVTGGQVIRPRQTVGFGNA